MVVLSTAYLLFDNQNSYKVVKYMITFLLYCRKSTENKNHSEFYAESHFVLPFSRKNLPKKSYSTFYFFDIAPASGAAAPFLSKQNKYFIN